MATTRAAATAPTPSPEDQAAEACALVDRLMRELADAMDKRGEAFRLLLRSGAPRSPIIRMCHRRSADGAAFAAHLAPHFSIEHITSVGRRSCVDQLRSVLTARPEET